MTIGQLPICDSCRRVDLDRKEPMQAPPCEAFPDGIPDEIYFEGFDHRQPFEGDRGLRYELEPGEEQWLAAYEETIE